MNRKTLLGILFVIIFTFAGLWSLVKSPFYTSHDGFTHTARIAAYYQALMDGQFPPRWAKNFNNNLGSPIFVYIYPLPYALGSVIHLFGVSFQDDFRLIMILSTIVSAVIMYIWLKDEFGNLPALAGAVFYVWVPYRFLNLYVRAAFAENMAYTLLPISFWAIKRKRWIMLTFTLIFLLLSHNEVAAIFIPILFLWAVLQKSVRIMLFSFLWAFLCALFIYLPDVFERKYVWLDEGLSYFRDHFVTWWQFIRSPWGYGFDFHGTVQDAMSFQLGIPQIITFILASVYAVKRKKIEAMFFIILTTVLIFLMTDSSIIVKVWEFLPGLKNIVDFPWRFIGVVTLSISYLAAFLVSQVKYKKLLVVILVLLAFLFNRNHLRINEVQNFSDDVFINFSGSGTATSGEFTPRWNNSHHFLNKNSANISNIKTGSSEISFSIIVSTPSSVLIDRFYFPETKIIGGNYSISNDGLINLNIVPPGGNYKITFTETPLRRAANVISLVAFTGFLSVCIKKKFFQ